MNRIKILIIIAIAIVGALLIYNHFDNLKVEDENINKFSTEYTLVKSDNIYSYKSIDEIINILNNGTGIIFLCTPESEWCQYYALYLNDVLKEKNIDTINYLNIKEFRDLNTTKYQKLVELLSNYIYKDDVNYRKIFMPDLTIVKDGKIIAHDNETSLVASDQIPDEYWTESSINSFKAKIEEYVELMNKEEIIDIEENIEE